VANIGIIGLGFMGRMHIAAYGKIDGANIVAVADRNEQRIAGDLSGGWGNVDGAAESIDMSDKFGTADFRELIARDEVDTVDICVPTPFHAELAIAALEAGKHVLCEKPLALTADDAQRIADAASKASGIFMPAMCMRFWPEWEWLKDAVDDGRSGVLRDLAIHRLGAMPEGWFQKGDMSGGGVLDLHVHDTDFLTYLLGAPDAVFSQGYKGPTGCVDHLHTQYIYNDGPPADWKQRFLTTYASAHPHEDWAETAAHLLHLTDITDSFIAAGLSSSEVPDHAWDPYAEPDAERLIYVAASLAVGVNHVNRSMGLSDLYPFVLPDTARQKLVFVHDWLRRGAQGL